ncbi:MAG: glycoside hydrolase family 25 protein [Anaerovoracaceae bacterium]
MNKRRILLTTVVTTLILAATCVLGFADAKVDNTTYTHDSKFSNCIIIDGVDVSYAQGGSVDWAKVKRSGMDYAFIRVGARSYGAGGRLIEDDFYKRNIEEAQKNGIQVGIYFYSQAINKFEARIEANYTLKLIAGYNIDLPVVMDYEFGGGSSGRLKAANLSKSEMTDNALTFMKTIEDAGYKSAFYANLMFLRNNVYSGTISSKYPIWLAQYNDYASFDGSYQIWQYTSGGDVYGTPGRTDCNFWYFDPTIVTPDTVTTKSIANCTASVNTNSYTFNKFQKKPGVNVSDGGIPLVEGVDYKLFYIGNVMAGTGRAMIKGMGKYTDVLLAPFTIEQQDFSNVSITVNDATYTGAPITPTVKVSYTGTRQKKNIDYTVTASNDGSIGTASVTINGIRNFKGSVTKTFTIKKGEPTIKTGYNSYTRTTANKYFTLKTKTDSDGALTYTSSDNSVVNVTSEGRVNIVGAGTAIITIRSAATASFNEGLKTVTVTVNQADVTPTPPTELPMPSLTVSRLSHEKDYDDEPFNVGAKTQSDGMISYVSSDTNVATVSNNGTVTIQGPGLSEITVSTPQTKKYLAATKKVKIIVNGGAQTIEGASSYSKTCISKDFSLDAKSNYNTKLTYLSSDEDILTISETGIVDIKDTGKATITVTAAASEYYDEVQKIISVSVRPQKQVIKVSNPYKNGFRVYVATDKHASGYQIKYSTSKSFSSNVATKYVNAPACIYRTYKVAHPGKMYYAKVRSYKIDQDGKKIYSLYSTVKSIRAK